LVCWMHLLMGLFVFLFPSEAGSTSFRPSFDCSRARYQDEMTICNDRKLSELDRIVSFDYGQIKGGD